MSVNVVAIYFLEEKIQHKRNKYFIDLTLCSPMSLWLKEGVSLKIKVERDIGRQRFEIICGCDVKVAIQILKGWKRIELTLGETNQMA